VFKTKTNNIPILKKDIFKTALDRINANNIGSTVIIPHVCNNINVFGAGFSGAISDIYPIVKENFYLLGNKAKLGHVQYIKVAQNKQYGHKIIVANMIAQNGTISHNNKRPLNYIALAACMNDIKRYIDDLIKEPEIDRCEIHAPKFGSGLAGGNWKFIEKLIEDAWINTAVYIYGN